MRCASCCLHRVVQEAPCVMNCVPWSCAHLLEKLLNDVCGAH